MQIYYYLPDTDACVINLGIHRWASWSSMSSLEMCKIMYKYAFFSVDFIS